MRSFRQVERLALQFATEGVYALGQFLQAVIWPFILGPLFGVLGEFVDEVAKSESPISSGSGPTSISISASFNRSQRRSTVVDRRINSPASFGCANSQQVAFS